MGRQKSDRPNDRDWYRRAVQALEAIISAESDSEGMYDRGIEGRVVRKVSQWIDANPDPKNSRKRASILLEEFLQARKPPGPGSRPAQEKLWDPDWQLVLGPREVIGADGKVKLAHDVIPFGKAKHEHLVRRLITRQNAHETEAQDYAHEHRELTRFIAVIQPGETCSDVARRMGWID